MKKKRFNFQNREVISCLKQISRVMKLMTFFLFVLFFQVSAGVFSQNNGRFSLKAEHESINNILKLIEDQTSYTFMYNRNNIDVERKTDINMEVKNIEEVLDKLFEGTNVKYRSFKHNYVLYTEGGALEISSKQSVSVSGKVSDSAGVPLPGVSVVIKSTTMGVVTNANGEYSLPGVPPDATLVFSFVGMTTQEVVVGRQTNINIVMKEETIGIEEVVAVGFGTQKKRNVVGSMSTVRGEEILKTPGTNLAQSLQGLASGVMVSNKSGHPGNAPDIKIRGVNSINLSSDPLWIVDGIPIFTGSSENTRDGVKGVSAISMLNPNDIKSIEVLKDAAATAIYGSRASGGVILVTTKSAKSEKAGIQLSYDGGLSQIPFSQNDFFVDSKTWWELMDTAARNQGVVEPDPASVMAIQFWGERPEMTKQEAIATNVDQLGAITHDAVFHQFGLTATKTFGKGGVLFSLNYRDEEGLIRNNDFQRLTGRFNFNFQPLESIEMGINSNFVYLKTNGVRSAQGKSNGGWGNWSSALPWYKIFDETSQTGYWAVNSGYNMRAFSDRKLTRYDVDQYRGINNAYIQWSPLDGLKVRGEVGADLIVNNNSFWRSSLLASQPPYYSMADEQSVTKSVVNYDVYANYNKTFNKIHNVDFTIGMEASNDWSYTRKFSGSGLQTVYPELRNPLQMNSMSGYQGGDTSIMGFFARGNYSLSDRYLLNASIRRDGHSAFSKENRWANFYAVGAGWIISDENFMKGLSFFNLLKLRGSYGITGNTAVSNSMTYMSWGLNTTNIWGIDVASGQTTVGPLGSADLQWETTANADFGIDFGILNNRINGSIAYYTQKISDLILAGNVQPSVGYNTNQIYENIGDMKNWGFEFNVSSSNIDKGDFSWRTDFNISTNKNKIVSLNEAEKGKGKEGTNDIRKEGEALNTWYMANYVHVDPEKGITMIEECDADVWNNDNKTVTTGNIIPATTTNAANNRIVQHGKTPLPTFYGGLSNTFTWKNFDLNILLVFEGGNWLYNGLYAGSHKVTSEGNTLKDVVGKMWEKPGDIAEYGYLIGGDDGWYYDGNGNPSKTKVSYSSNQTTQYLEKGDYIRVRNLQLGYTLPKSVFGASSLNSVRFYMGVTNLFTITGYRGLDPESESDLPMPRTFNFGFSLNL